jgi:hypothetical protein
LEKQKARDTFWRVPAKLRRFCPAIRAVTFTSPSSSLILPDCHFFGFPPRN